MMRRRLWRITKFIKTQWYDTSANKWVLTKWCFVQTKWCLQNKLVINGAKMVRKMGAYKMVLKSAANKNGA